MRKGGSRVARSLSLSWWWWGKELLCIEQNKIFFKAPEGRLRLLPAAFILMTTAEAWVSYAHSTGSGEEPLFCYEGHCSSLNLFFLSISRSSFFLARKAQSDNINDTERKKHKSMNLEPRNMCSFLSLYEAPLLFLLPLTD